MPDDLVMDLGEPMTSHTQGPNQGLKSPRTSHARRPNHCPWTPILVSRFHVKYALAVLSSFSSSSLRNNSKITQQQYMFRNIKTSTHLKFLVQKITLLEILILKCVNLLF